MKALHLLTREISHPARNGEKYPLFMAPGGTPSLLLQKYRHLSRFRLNTIKPAKKHKKSRLSQQRPFAKNLTAIYIFGYCTHFDMEA